MTFTGNENHDISLSQASAWTKNYRDTITSSQIISHYFGKKAIQDLFDQANCVGMRLYYAINDLGVKELIIVGVDPQGNDIYNGLLLDRSIKCPQDCPAANPLNTAL